MAIKNTADLTSENNSSIATQTATETIGPPLAGQMFQDIIDSMFNQSDGIKVNGMTIPAYFTFSITNGMKLEDILSVIMASINQVSIAVTGGIQGLIGEFLAAVTSNTNQLIVADDNTLNTYVRVAVIKLPNDASDGGFDNGNSWLLDRFIIPSGFGGGYANVNFSASGLVINHLDGDPTTGQTRKVKFLIAKNGVQIGSVQSNEISIAHGATFNTKYYLTDFSTGNIAINTLSANDIITLELWAEQNYYVNLSPSDGARIQIISGFFNNKLS